MPATKLLLLFSLVIATQLAACGQTKNKSDMTEHKYANQLIHESSPYLLQHAHNPVDWYPWGPEALAKAKKENKLLLISIGYAACHWCHVMEHESFEDSAVAAVMNEHFVCIKVDREERPDIDQIYMTAVQLLTKQGGWPLNCIALADGRPLYGGTYFPKENWVSMLQQVSQFVKDNPDKAEQQAAALAAGVQQSETIVQVQEQANFKMAELDELWKGWRQNIDFDKGGGNRAPKFPMPTGLNYLLQYSHATGNKEAMRAVENTLHRMADGGIYDQVGGGFSRYSVDDIWKVPHFEKMLYDNAQLLSVYAAAYQSSKDERYKEIMDQTIAFLERELKDKSGGYYSSLDADSEGEEGLFYIWKGSELRGLLGADAELIMDYYTATEKGNWEHGQNILYITKQPAAIAKKHKISEKVLAEKVAHADKILLAERSKRIRPATDDKILTAWNGLLVTGLADAYKATGNEAYLQKATALGEFIHAEMTAKDGSLLRNYKDGKGSITAFLDDYAFTIEGYVSLYQTTLDEQWLLRADALTKYSLAHFGDTKSQMLFYTSDQSDALIARKMELSDNVIPSSNSQMAKNLFVLGQYLYNPKYLAQAKAMLQNVQENTVQGGAYFSNWASLMLWEVQPPYEVAIVGADAQQLKLELQAHYLPNVLMAGGTSQGSLEMLEDKLVAGKTMIYVCQAQVCKKPETTVAAALQQIKK